MVTLDTGGEVEKEHLDLIQWHGSDERFLAYREGGRPCHSNLCRYHQSQKK